MYLVAPYLSLIFNDLQTNSHILHIVRRSIITVVLLNYTALFNLDSEQTFIVKAIKLHENYDNNTNDNDIALLQIEGSITFGRSVEPICIPSQGYEFDTSLQCFAAGWGHTKFNGTGSLHLLQVKVSCLYREYF